MSPLCQHLEQHPNCHQCNSWGNWLGCSRTNPELPRLKPAMNWKCWNTRVLAEKEASAQWLTCSNLTEIFCKPNAFWRKGFIVKRDKAVRRLHQSLDSLYWKLHKWPTSLLEFSLWWYNMCGCGKRAPVKSSKILIPHLWKINSVLEMQFYQVSAVHNTVTGLIVPLHFFCATFWRQFLKYVQIYLPLPLRKPPQNWQGPRRKKVPAFYFLSASTAYKVS